MSSSKMKNSCSKESNHKCLNVHGRRPISAVPSFFKIMLGDFEKAMFIPPTFAPNLGELVNRSVSLEDSLGNCWTVKLSMVDGSLAFREGWPDFVSDHSISFGELVIFKHISTSLFTVQIYGTSGSERFKFRRKENSGIHKRKRSTSEISPDILSLIKGQKIWEESEGRHAASNKNSHEKYTGERSPPPGFTSNGMAAKECTTRAAGKHTNSLEEPHFHVGPGKVHNSKIADSANAPPQVIDVCGKTTGGGRNSPIVLSDDEDLDTHVDVSKGRKKMSAKKHPRNREMLSQRCLITTERKSSAACKKAVGEKEVLLAAPKTPVHPETSQGKKNLKGRDIVKAIRESLMSIHKSKSDSLFAPERKTSSINNNAVCKQEVVQNSPTPDFSKTSQIKGSPQDTKKLEVIEEKPSYPHARLFVSEEKSSLVNKNAVCKQQVVQNSPPDFPKAAQTKGGSQDTKKLEVIEEKPSCLHVRLFVSEEKSSLVNKNAVCKQKVVQNSPPDFPKAAQSKGGSQDTKKMEVIEEKPSYPHDRLKRDKTDSTGVNVGAVLVASVGLVAERVESDIMYGEKGEATRESSSLQENSTEVPSRDPTANCNGESQCPSHKETDNSNKSEEILENHAEFTDLARTSEGNFGNQADSANDKTLQEINCNQSDRNLENNADCSQAIKLQVVDTSQSEWNFETENTEKNADPLQSRTVRSSSLVMADISGFCEGQTSREVDPFPTGVFSGKLREMDDEKISLCSKGEVLAAVKSERIDPTDDTSLGCAEFCTTVSLISQSWLLLPEKLPARLLKKRCLRTVVLLQDPSARHWPVLYHEDFKFVGLLGGWEDFAVANGLKVGDTCQIESISASEPTFRVQFRNLQNPE